MERILIKIKGSQFIINRGGFVNILINKEVKKTNLLLLKKIYCLIDCVNFRWGNQFISYYANSVFLKFLKTTKVKNTIYKHRRRKNFVKKMTFTKYIISCNVI